MAYSPGTRSGPRIHHILLFIVALTCALYVLSGRSAQVLVEDFPIGSVSLEESYLLYFEPVSDMDPEQTLANRKRYAQQYEAIITHGLDGNVQQQYDTLLTGFSFSLGYSDKVMRAIGLDHIPEDVDASTFRRLREFLQSYAGADMAKDNVRMLLEKDGDVSING